MELEICYRRPENQMTELFTNKAHMKIRELALDNQNN